MGKEGGVFSACVSRGGWRARLAVDVGPHPAWTVLSSPSDSRPRAPTLGPGRLADSHGLSAVCLQSPDPRPKEKQHPTPPQSPPRRGGWDPPDS